MRQGTSRIVPVVVSAGLAVGVFCGLLFGLGTGEGDAAPVKVSNGAKRAEEVVPDLSGTGVNKIVTTPPTKVGSNAGSAVAAGSGSAGAGSATGSAGSGSAAEPAAKTSKLIVEIKPESAIPSVKVFIDGKEIAGTTAEITMEPGVDKKTVKVTVKAPGFKDIEYEQEIEAGEESTTLKLELAKGRSSATTTAATSGTSGTSGTTGGTTTGTASAGGAGTTGTTVGTKGTASAGGAASGSGTTGTAGARPSGGGTKSTGGSRPSSGGSRPSGKGKGKGKGSGGLIDI